MDGFDSHSLGGSLQISTEVIEKIASFAAMEVGGVLEVKAHNEGAKSLLDKITQPKAVLVELKSDVADISISLIVEYGAKIPDLSELVQKNVKDSVQNMTGITVARVDVIVSGLGKPTVEE